MFTSNYQKYKNSEFLGTSLTVIAYDGSSLSTSSSSTARALYSDIGYYMKNAYCKVLSSGTDSTTALNQCSAGIYFGSGITPPAEDDYTLEFPIFTGLSIVNVASNTLKYDSKHYAFCTTVELTNDVSIDITVAEVGLFGQSGTGSKYPVLYERTVLETPIVIAPGETKVIQYWVDMNQFFGGA